MGRHGPRGDCGCCDYGTICDPVTLTVEVTGFTNGPEDCICGAAGGISHQASGWAAINGTVIASTVGKTPVDGNCGDVNGDTVTTGSDFSAICEFQAGKTASVSTSGGNIVASATVNSGAESIVVNMPSGSVVGDSHSENHTILLCSGSNGFPVEASITITLTLS